MGAGARRAARGRWRGRLQQLVEAHCIGDDRRPPGGIGGTDPVHAREDLAEAVSLLVERPALEAALSAATARFEQDPEGSIAEQASYRERLLALNDRLKRFGRMRAAAADSTRSGEGLAPRSRK